MRTGLCHLHFGDVIQGGEALTTITTTTSPHVPPPGSSVVIIVLVVMQRAAYATSEIIINYTYKYTKLLYQKRRRIVLIVNSCAIYAA